MMKCSLHHFTLALVALIDSRARAMLPNLALVDSPPPLNSPVFSLATVGADGVTDMNILTYCSPVGIRPTRKWAVSLYRSTLSHQNFVRNGGGVLQLLRVKHAGLTFTLGGQVRAFL